jgi:hypothetical protein
MLQSLRQRVALLPRFGKLAFKLLACVTEWIAPLAV